MRAAGKEATREAQNRGRGYRGVAAPARSSPDTARASFISIFAQDLDPGLRLGSVVSRPVPKLGPAGIDERTAPLEIRLNSSTRTGYAATANT